MKVVQIVIVSLGLVASVGCGPAKDSGSRVSNFANGEAEVIEIIPDISLKSGINKWVQEDLMDSGPLFMGTDKIQCSNVTELMNVVLCGSQLRTGLEVLTRASIYVEGWNKTDKGTIVKLNSTPYNEAARLIRGHDLKSEDIAKFWKDLTLMCELTGENNYCPSPLEQEFYTKVVEPRLKLDKPFVVLTFTADYLWRSYLTHEVHHAQYFTQSMFHDAVFDFWNLKVSSNDREQILKILGETYNASDKDLILNEFQAYLLMEGAADSKLKLFVNTYTGSLESYLSNIGQSPISLEVASSL